MDGTDVDDDVAAESSESTSRMRCFAEVIASDDIDVKDMKEDDGGDRKRSLTLPLLSVINTILLLLSWMCGSLAWYNTIIMCGGIQKEERENFTRFQEDE